MHRPIVVLLMLLGPLFASAEEALPAYLIRLPASVANILIAESTTATLHRFSNDGNGVHAADQRYMSVGRNGVGKQQAWDRRTPLGVYFISEQLATQGLHEKYGPTAFPLDYPNAWDRLQGRDGDGIWIHGVAEDGVRRPPRDTDGCIALPNDELLLLEPLLQPTVTPVLVTRQIVWAGRAELDSLQNRLEAAIASWQNSFTSGDLHRLLSMYADDFSYRGMDRTEWASYRMQSLAERRVDSMAVEELLLLADPEDVGLYVSRFRLQIVGQDGSVAMTKRLYWRQVADGSLRIVAEDNG